MQKYFHLVQNMKIVLFSNWLHGLTSIWVSLCSLCSGSLRSFLLSHLLGQESSSWHNFSYLVYISKIPAGANPLKWRVVFLASSSWDWWCNTIVWIKWNLNLFLKALLHFWFIVLSNKGNQWINTNEAFLVGRFLVFSFCIAVNFLEWLSCPWGKRRIRNTSKHQ